MAIRRTVISGRPEPVGPPPGSNPTPLAPRPGDRFEAFELERAIGVGGMGAVFLAIDTRLQREVALKILPPEQSNDSEIVQRFYQEGRAAARLDHENIARVFTIGSDRGYHFIAFEYIEGSTLRQRVLDHGPLPIGEAINYTLQIAGALVHASERGVVHRDVKPSNIIVTPQGRAKLVDMGLARRFERGQRRRRPHPERHHARHLRLHQPRAGPRPSRRGRSRRPVLARLHALPHARPAARRSPTARSSRSSSSTRRSRRRTSEP